MLRRLGLRVEPLDTLFFGDGRPFGLASRASGSLPTPQPLAGALRTNLLARSGFNFSKMGTFRGQDATKLDELRQFLRAEVDHGHGWIVDTSFRGPWLAIESTSQSVEPLLPVPANLVRSKNRNGNGLHTWYRAQPKTNVAGWQPPAEGMLPLWYDDAAGAASAKYPGGFLNLEGVNQYLLGGKPTDENWFDGAELYQLSPRTGIGINADTLTTEEQLIYGVNFLALCRKLERAGTYHGKSVCIYAEMLVGEGAPESLAEYFSEPFPLGGEGRYATATVLDNPVAWPPFGAPDHPAGQSLWLLATNGIFWGEHGESWRPATVAPPARLVSAASRQPVAISGFDLVRNAPKPARFAVPAGSVYYVEGDFHPNANSLCDDDEDVAQGWGFALQGVWKDG